MDGLQDERPEYEFDEDPGTTLVLTESGWEHAAYIGPGDDWDRMPDGSYLAPDGLTRTFPLSAE
jgi:hypothetical protein